MFALCDYHRLLLNSLAGLAGAISALILIILSPCIYNAIMRKPQSENPKRIWWVLFIISSLIGVASGAIAATAPEKPCHEVVIVRVVCKPDGNDPLAEFVILENQGKRPIDMNGWQLCDSQKNHCFEFAGFELAGESQVAIWTGKGENSAEALYWMSSRPIWNNEGDTAYLIDAKGRLIVDHECSAGP